MTESASSATDLPDPTVSLDDYLPERDATAPRVVIATVEGARFAPGDVEDGGQEILEEADEYLRSEPVGVGRA